MTRSNKQKLYTIYQLQFFWTTRVSVEIFLPHTFSAWNKTPFTTGPFQSQWPTDWVIRQKPCPNLLASMKHEKESRQLYVDALSTRVVIICTHKPYTRFILKMIGKSKRRRKRQLVDNCYISDFKLLSFKILLAQNRHMWCFLFKKWNMIAIPITGGSEVWKRAN